MKNRKQRHKNTDNFESSCSPSISYPPIFQLCMPAVALLFLAILAVTLPPTGKDLSPVRVAFIGNSITFVNDIPRLVEVMAQGRLQQDSCLHGSLNFMTILSKGNGMYSKWQTQNAFVKKISTTSSNKNQQGEDEQAAAENTNTIIYDFGACSVQQLLLGHDFNLYSDTFFYDDGKNPCLSDAHYLNYRESLYPKYATSKRTNRDGSVSNERVVIQEQPNWDYVVMNDQTQYPATFQRRRRSILVLKQVYAPLFLETGAVPVFLMTHGYSTANRKASTQRLLGDVPTFTSHLYYGYRQYVNALAQKLPARQHPRMANAGLAFLTIYEEDYALWEKLVFVDGFHPSPHGSYLIGCVLYATIFRRMPPSMPLNMNTGTNNNNNNSTSSSSSSTSSSTSTPEASALFARARRMQLESGPEMPLPTALELRTLNSVCRRVALQDYKPPSLLSLEETEQLELENQDTGNWYHTDTVPLDDDVFSEEEQEDDGDDDFDDKIDDDGALDEGDAEGEGDNNNNDNA